METKKELNSDYINFHHQNYNKNLFWTQGIFFMQQPTIGVVYTRELQIHEIRNLARKTNTSSFQTLGTQYLELVIIQHKQHNVFSTQWKYYFHHISNEKKTRIYWSSATFLWFISWFWPWNFNQLKKQSSVYICSNGRDQKKKK